MCAIAGLELDQWQQFVLTHALGERADGKWAAPTVGLVVGRQNGKNTILEARELAGLFLLGEKTIIHSAHEQATSSEHFRRLLGLISGVPEFESRILKVSHGKGAEAIELRGGQRVLFKTRTGGGGRGFSVDLIVFDEAMILSAAAKAALIPTLAANSMKGNLQTWYAGSAVDQLNPKHDGIELARVRQQAMEGVGAIAYFEWSAPGEDPARVTEEEAADLEQIGLANPGLGIRISPEWVEHERLVELGAREYAVERLGVGDWPDALGGSVINLELWDELADTGSQASDQLVFAFDVAPDRSSASVCVASRRGDGLLHVETMERRHGQGPGWIVDWLRDRVEKHKPLAVVCDGAGPAGSLIPDLERAKVTVDTVATGEYAQACGIFFDAVQERTLRHLGQPELDAAVRGASTRPLGERWAWSRKNSGVDITPLVGCTLALFGLASRVKKAPPRLIDLASV